MNFLLFKSLHIISVVTWFAGLFYLPRIFIYEREAQEKIESEKIILTSQFQIMSRRLLFGITWPSAIAVAIFGFSSAAQFWPWSNYPWLIYKLIFVLFLYLYHFSLHYIYKLHNEKNYKYSPTQLRIWNEVSTLFLVSIVFLVIFKNVLHLGYAVLGLILFIFLLLFAIKTYKKMRMKNESR